jgi:CheY-like chemotaxis protein
VTDNQKVNLAGRSILLIEHDQDLRDTLKGLLELHNFVVTTAHNGLEGLRQVMHQEFDVIISSFIMPVLRGDVFYLAVQKIKPHLCGCFVFMTGSNDPKIGEFIQKVDGLLLFYPIASEDLLRTITVVWKRSEKHKRFTAAQ